MSSKRTFSVGINTDSMLHLRKKHVLMQTSDTLTPC